MDIEDLKVVEPDALHDLDKQIEMKYLGEGSLKGFVVGRVVIRNNKGEVKSKSSLTKILPVYFMTERGTYLINGSEKNVLKLMRRKPGVYTSKNGGKIESSLVFDNKLFDTSYMPQIAMTFDPTETKFKVTIKKGKDVKLDGVTFLRLIGLSDQQIRKAIGNDAVADILVASAKPKTIDELYTAISGQRHQGTESETRQALYDYLTDNAQFGSGEGVVTSTLGLKEKSLNLNVVARSVEKMFSVYRGQEEEDDTDDLRYKEVLADNDIIMEQIDKAFTDFESRAIQRLSTGKSKYTDFKNIFDIGGSVDKFMTQSTLVQNTEQNNPLFVAAVANKVTQLGDNGGVSSDAARNIVNARNIKSGSFGRIDPVETPESGNIGLVEHLTQSAVVKDKTIYIPVYKVVNGQATALKSKEKELSPEQEYNARVAYFDSRYVEKNGTTIVFKSDKTPCRHQGKNVMLEVSQVQYIDTAPQNLFNVTANMTPFVNHNDGNRALMGTNMQRQAICLKNREVPLVTTSSGDGATYEQKIGEKYGKPVKSTVDGTVKRVEKSKIIVEDKDGNEHAHNYYNHYPLNQSFINNEVIVNAGQPVKKGDILAEGWQTKGGQLALGVNAKVAFLSYKGYNYEDGMVISESFANKAASEEMFKYTVDIREDWKGGRGSSVQREFKAYTTKPEPYSLDVDGIAKEGTDVKAGSILVGVLTPYKNKQDALGLSQLIGTSTKGEQWRYRSETIEHTSYIEGKIQRVTIVNNPEAGVKQRVIFSIVGSKPLKEGDKLSGKHGNKGTISKILPDDEMPTRADGERLDVLISPLAIPSRKNLGQTLELAAGLIAEKEGTQISIDNFDTHPEKIDEGLKRIGVPDGKMMVNLKEKRADGSIIETKTENPVAVGNMYILRLKHKIDDKLQARSNMEGSGVNNQTYMPTKQVGSTQGEKYNPQSMGEMELRALQGHGATYNLLDSTTIKADGGGDTEKRMAIFNAIATGNLDALDFSATPQTVKYLADNLKAVGLSLKPINNGKDVKSFDKAFDSVAITPIKPSEMIKMIGKDKEVVKPYLTMAKDNGEDVPYSGGLLDPKIFGDSRSPEARGKWGYVKLATPMPNPLLLDDVQHNPYSLLTGIATSDLKRMMNGSHVLVIDPKTYTKDKDLIDRFNNSMTAAGLKPGDVVEATKLERMSDEFGEILWKAGGEGLQHMLDNVDVKKELNRTKDMLNKADPKDVDKLFKKTKTLMMLERNKMAASDLMLHYMPVAPAYMRPYIQKGDGSVQSHDLNKLYANLVNTNKPMQELYQNGFDMILDAHPTDAARSTAALYKKVSQVTVARDDKAFIDPKKKTAASSIMATVGGAKKSKDGLIRDKMLSKKQDFSGRSVIGVDPMLDMNEIGIPIDMAKVMYKPFILKELVKTGKAANTAEALKKWQALDKDAKQAIKSVADDRPVLANRQPSLHKYSILAFKPVIQDVKPGETPKRNIHLNPLVVTAFNADFDGDQMAVHVPITEKSKEEAKRILMPTENLINVTDGSMTFSIRQEMALGIFYLTKDAKKVSGQPKRYSTYIDLRRDYREGKIGSRENVSIGNLNNVTAGYALFIMLLPERFRKESYHEIRKPWNAKDINRLFHDMYVECEESKGKTISKTQISQIMDKVKRLGFEASTKSGVSLGITDFKQIDTDKLMKELSIDKDNMSIEDSKKLEKAIEQGMNDHKFIDPDSAVGIILDSKSRGNAGQFRRMMGVMGTGMDVTFKEIDPVQSSLLQGLSPQDYWMHSKDSRKGMYDRSVSTAKPGDLTRRVWSATQDMQIKDKDCGTNEGISVNKENTNILGRFAVEPIVGKDGSVLCKRGQMIDHSIKREIHKDDTIKMVKVRSPLKCKTAGGICQKCYGSMPGSTQLPEMGTSIGVLASQALGEPVTQMTMNTFHSGGSNSSATLGLPRVDEILDVSELSKNPDKSVLASVSGKVTSIIEGSIGTYDTVVINQKPHKVPHRRDGSRRPLKVKIGDQVSKGDFITYGDIADLQSGSMLDFTKASPKDMFKLKSDELGQEKALDYTQNYLKDSLTYAISQSTGNPNAVDSRHVETVISKLTSKVKITDAGDSNYLRGETIDKSVADKWNAENMMPYSAKTVSLSNGSQIIGRLCADRYTDKAGIVIAKNKDVITTDVLSKLLMSGLKTVKVYPKPIAYEVEIHSKNTVATAGHGNFVSNLGHQSVKSQLSRAVTLGQVDKLEDNRARVMVGKPILAGQEATGKRRFMDSFATSVKDIFSK